MHERLNEPTFHTPLKIRTGEAKGKSVPFRYRTLLWSQLPYETAAEAGWLSRVWQYLIPKPLNATGISMHLLVKVLYLFSMCLKRLLHLLLLQEPLSLTTAWMVWSASPLSETGCRISLSCFHLAPNNSAWTKPALPDKHQPRGSAHWKNHGTRSTCTYTSFYVWMHLNLTHIYLSLFWLSPLGWKDCIWFCFPAKAL